jgi:uncharacterized protein (TIGR02271 family)
MIDRNDLDRLEGMDVHGSDGEKIGSVDVMYVDDHSGDPTFALVNTGLFGMRSSFVPVQDARLDGDVLRVSHSKDKVKDAPNMDPDGHLEPSDEQELYRYYGMDAGTSHDDRTAGTPGTAGTAGTADDIGRSDRDTEARGTAGGDTVGHDTSGPETDDAMTRSEEELHVGTEKRQTGKARLRKHVVTEHVQKTVPVRREEVSIEREPVTDANAGDATDGPALSEEEHEVTLHEEEPVVEKRVVPKERVRLDKEVHTDEEQVDADVAHEEIDVAGLEESREGQHRR